MKLIKSIAISGFRSIDECKLKDLEDLSIVFGRNDAGKSNVLRALNLFFNGETNEGQRFDIERDLHVSRTGRNRMVQIWVEVNTPDRYPSLKSTFWVRKTWSSSGSPTVLYPRWVRDKQLRSARQLLNSIDYHYIPAIKSNAIFEKLLGDVYSILSEDETFRASLERFAKEVQARTTALSDSLAKNVGLTSLLAPPTDLQALFRSLDFLTGKEHEFSLLLQRGDGIKVRHIPEIMSFICSHRSSRFHVWGFEEPENSLEYANAICEAEAFRRYAAEPHTQVVITSHSPAFYNLGDGNVRRFHVSKPSDDDAASKAVAGTRVDVIAGGEDPADLMGEGALLASMAGHLRDVQAELDRQRIAIEELEEALGRRRRPVVFVEGESDRLIIEAAYKVVFPGETQPYDVFAAQGTTQMTALHSKGASLGIVGGFRLVCVLVDNDPEGRRVSPSALKKHPTQWVQNPENETWWARLAFSDDFTRLMKRLRVSEDQWTFTIEHVVASELFERAVGDGAYRHGPPHSFLTTARLWDQVRPLLDGPEGRYLSSPHHAVKVPFAQWVADNATEPRHFEQLAPILHGLRGRCLEHRARRTSPPPAMS